MTASLPMSRGAHFDDGQTVFGLLGPGLAAVLGAAAVRRWVARHRAAPA